MTETKDKTEEIDATSTEVQMAQRNALGQLLPGHTLGWKKGQSGNPGGTRTAGAYITEQLNALVSKTDKELRGIAADKALPASRRIAAQQLLKAMREVDPADFEAYIDGSKTLTELRKGGADTRGIKKMAKGQKGSSLDFTADSGEALDRILDRTHGKAVQRIEAAVVDDRSGAEIAAELMRVVPPKLLEEPE